MGIFSRLFGKKNAVTSTASSRSPVDDAILEAYLRELEVLPDHVRRQIVGRVDPHDSGSAAQVRALAAQIMGKEH